MTLTVPRSLDDVIAAIRARDAAAPWREAWDPVRWDTALADEVERLRALVARHEAEGWERVPYAAPRARGART